MGSFFLGLLG